MSHWLFNLERGEGEEVEGDEEDGKEMERKGRGAAMGMNEE